MRMPMAVPMLIITSLLIAGCVAMPSFERGSGTSEGTAATGTQKQKKETEPFQANDRLAFETMESYIAKGGEAFGLGRTSEAIKQYVATLAVYDKLKTKDADSRRLKDKAERELAAIGTVLSLEPGTEWLDVGKNVISVSTTEAGKKGALNPTVTLAVNVGSGRTVVSEAPILFSFIRGSGTLSNAVSVTNEYGVANCLVLSLENPNKEAVIRATVHYTVQGFTYSFQQVKCDFTYSPPSKNAVIVVLDHSEEGASKNPLMIDAVYNAWNDVGVSFAPYNGTLLGDDFFDVYNGNKQSVKALGSTIGVNYLFVVYTDVYSVTQTKFGGKEYNIFKAGAKVSLRIIRVEDGAILYSTSADSVSGQGNSKSAAIADAYRNAVAALIPNLKSDTLRVKRLFE